MRLILVVISPFFLNARNAWIEGRGDKIKNIRTIGDPQNIECRIRPIFYKISVMILQPLIISFSEIVKGGVIRTEVFVNKK